MNSESLSQDEVVLEKDNQAQQGEQKLSCPGHYEELKSRLDEIVEIVSDPEIQLDEALRYYEEAVGLGLQAASLLEEDIAEHDVAFDEARNDMSQEETESNKEQDA